jgi:hypothetical protein
VPWIFSVAAKAPVVEGVNVNRTVHEPLTAIVPPLTHVPVPELAKLDGLAPVIVKNGVAKTSAAVPVLETVSVVAPLVVPCV